MHDRVRVYLRTKRVNDSVDELDIHGRNWMNQDSGQVCFVKVVLEGQS